jgi:hypothetical protein
MTPLLRGALLASGPVNLMGAVLFAPPSLALRAAFGVPEAPAFYQWTLSLWVLAFGVAYALAGWRRRTDASLLVLGAFGKLVFVALMTMMAWRGEVPMTTALASTPDLLLAVIFGHAWWRNAAAGNRISTL